MSRPDPEDRDRGGAPKGVEFGLAAIVFALVLATQFSELTSRDLTRFVPAPPADTSGDIWEKRADYLSATDHRFVVWLVGRNARTWWERPSSLFDAEPCYPAENSLAFGESALTPGLLGAPIYAVTQDPVATYNGVLLLVTWLSGLAMFVLVREWSGRFTAGIIAGLLYAFSATKIGDPVHFYAWDSAWTVLALFFARRLFDAPRWRDAGGLAICCMLQIGGSFYPLFSAVFIAIPVLFWLMGRYGLAKLRIAHVVLVLAGIALATFVALAPYFSMRSGGELGARAFQYFFVYDWLAPGQQFFPGWILLVLVALAFSGRAKALTGSRRLDPRWALLVAGLLVMNLAAGGMDGQILWDIAHDAPPPETSIPNLYNALARWLPGLEMVRAPAALFGGVHLVLCVLAGLGAARVLRWRSGITAYVLGVLLVLAAFVDTLRPSWLGLNPRTRYAIIEIRPPLASIEFFVHLEEIGNEGPLLELPVNPTQVAVTSEGVLRSAYHHRRTSHCYNSFIPEEIARLQEISKRLPEAEALREVREMGFTTLITHHPPTHAFEVLRNRRFKQYLAEGGSGLRLLHHTESLSAYALER